jgi:hypothetical protein
MSAALRAHRYAHALVQFNDGARWELILNNCTSLEKQNVMKALTISRAVYADADAHDNYLDWIRFFVSPTWDWKGHLQYSHPTTWDLFLDENVKQGEVVKDHMPGIIIQYIIQD